MGRRPSVLLIAGDKLAVRATRAALAPVATVVVPESPARMSPVGRRFSSRGASGMRPDVVLVEDTFSAPEHPLAIAGALAPDVPILSVVSLGDGQYRWIRARPVGDLFQLEESGMGTLHEAVATAVRSQHALARHRVVVA